MEFDIGNLLYVIITIVVIAVGLLGRKKRPAGSGTGETGAARKPGFLENLERLLDQERINANFGGEVDETIQHEGAGYVIEDEDTGYVTEDEGPGSVFAERDVMSPVQEEPANRGILDEYERFMARQGEAPATADEPLEVIELDEDSGTDYFEVIADFNPAKAIVYSAIINRIDY